MADIARNRQYRPVTEKLDRRTLRLYPKACLVTVDQLHLDTPRHVFAAKALGYRFAKQGAVGGFDEISDFATDQLRRLEVAAAVGGEVLPPAKQEIPSDRS